MCSRERSKGVAMKTDYEECLAVAERAAEWIIRLPEATLVERHELMNWLRESPLHVREFLLAATCKDLLEQLAPFTNLDANAFVQSDGHSVANS